MNTVATVSPDSVTPAEDETKPIKESDFFGGELDRRAAIDDAYGRLLDMKLAALDVKSEDREKAKAMVAACATEGFDENVLWYEWRNDVVLFREASKSRVMPILSAERDPFTPARKDPSSAYLAWLKERLDDPFRVSWRAVMRALRVVPLERANHFRDISWHQEIAWAHRLRASDDDRTAIASGRFLLLATKDASTQFVRLVKSWVSVDSLFNLAPAHLFTAEDIRIGMGTGEHEPLFLRLIRAETATWFDKADLRTRRLVADRVREAENSAQKVFARIRAVELVRKAPLARLVGVIQVAIEMGFSSDQLVEEESVYVGMLDSGEVEVPAGTGLPYQDFLHWLRLRKPSKSAVLGPTDSIEAEGERLDIILSPRRWIEGLPRDYGYMDAANPLVFQQWFMPIRLNERPFPRDPRVDYGFHLVRRSFTKGKKR